VKLLKGFLEVFDRAAFILVAALMGAMGVIAFMAVFYRFVLHDPITWSEEAARYMMVWVTFLGAGYAMGKGRHIGVTMFVEKLPEGARRKVTFAAEIIIMVFLAAVTVQGIKLMIGLWGQTSPAMDFPMWMPYLAIPVGSVYMFMHLLYLVLSRSSQSISTADLELEAALKGKDGAGQ
jgi:TRAP-type C4-dicarboxylate transport system permease small subunit